MPEKSEGAGSKTNNRDRFVRIAEKRVNRVLDAIETLGNCSNKKNYEYTQDDVRKIFSEIERKIKETKALFHETGRENKRFHL